MQFCGQKFGMHIIWNAIFLHKLKPLVIFVALIFSAGNPLSSQTIQYSGKIQSKKTRENISFATIAFYNASDSAFQYSAISDSLGEFALTIQAKKYIVSINHLNFNPYHTIVDLRSSSAEKHLLQPRQMSIDAITVRAKSLNTEGNSSYVLSKIASDEHVVLGTVLPQLPGVVSDFQNKLKLNGSNAQLVLDGRKVSYTEIENMPASQIERVTIIENPSSRYETNGLSGIIKLTSKQNNTETSALLSTSFSSNAQSGALAAHYHKQRISLSGQFSVWNNQQNGSIEIRKQQSDFSEVDAHIKYHTANVFSKYQLQENEFISLGYKLTRKAYSAIDVSEKRMGNTTMLAYFNQLSFNYNKQLLRPGEEFDLKLFYNHTNPETTTEISAVTDPYFIENRNLNKSFVGKFDYTLPVNTISTIESGLMNSWRKIAISRTHNMDSTPKTNAFVFDEHVLSSYLIFKTRGPQVLFTTGIRAETLVSKKYEGSRKWDLFPSLNFEYQLSPHSRISFYYNKRINRPSASSLNPYVLKIDPHHSFMGNPELKPEYAHNIGIKTDHKKGKSSLRFSAYYRIINDLISKELDVSKNVFQPINIERTRYLGFDASAGIPILKHGLFQPNLGVITSHIQAQIAIPLKHVNAAYVGMLFRLDLPHNFRTQLSGKVTTQSLSVGTSSQSAIVQGLALQDAQFSSEINLSKSCFSKKLNLFLRVSDPFRLTKTAYRIYHENGSYKTRYHLPTRFVYAGLSYSFNQHKKKKNAFEDGGIKVLN